MTERSNDPLSPAKLAAAARQLYADCALMPRLLQSYRPYICPFHLLLPWAPTSASVLDVGCGSGLMLGLINWCGRISDGFGFDANGGAINAAQCMARTLQELRPDAPPLRFEHRAVDQPWTTDTFDLVCLIDVMHHVPTAQRDGLVEKLIDRVKPGGRLIYKDMAARPLWRAWANRTHDLCLARQWVRYYPPQRVRHICEQKNLLLVHTQRINMLWYGHDLLVFDKPAD